MCESCRPIPSWDDAAREWRPARNRRTTACPARRSSAFESSRSRDRQDRSRNCSRGCRHRARSVWCLRPPPAATGWCRRRGIRRNSRTPYELASDRTGPPGCFPSRGRCGPCQTRRCRSTAEQINAVSSSGGGRCAANKRYRCGSSSVSTTASGRAAPPTRRWRGRNPVSSKAVGSSWISVWRNSSTGTPILQLFDI
jgi:hypothetical protein